MLQYQNYISTHYTNNCKASTAPDYSAPHNNGFVFSHYNTTYYEKALRETQTLRAGCSKVEPKISALLQTPFPGMWDGQNLISWRMITTFTYKPGLVRIRARNFVLSS